MALPAQAKDTVTIFPKTISETCFNGRAVSYDECGFQRDLFDRALRVANQADKRLLIVYGAEWCIWCHVFKEHIKGKTGKFHYKLEGQDGYRMDEHANADDIENAAKLSKFVANTFVVVNIEGQHSFDGYDVLNHTGASDHIGQSIPYIFTVDKNGSFLADLPSTIENPTLEKRREGDDWYRGYNRAELMTELMKISVVNHK
jgi:thioredoxin-related protein